MAIMNQKQAAKMLRKAISLHGSIGNDLTSFTNQFFSMHNHRPSQEEINYLLGALEDGEQKREFYVTRNGLGSPIIVEKFDYEKAVAMSKPVEPVEPTKPEISNLQLLPLMQAYLYKRCNSRGVLVTRRTMPVLIKEMTQEFSRDYDLRPDQVNEVFEAMWNLKLRGDAAMLRGRGMRVAQPDETKGNASDSVTKERLTHDLDQALAQLEDLQRQMDSRTQELCQQLSVRTDQYKDLSIRHRELTDKCNLLQEENDGVMGENSELTEENGRLSQSIADLRIRNQELADITQRVYDVVAECNKNE